jgi:hypothetical protein
LTRSIKDEFIETGVIQKDDGPGDPVSSKPRKQRRKKSSSSRKKSSSSSKSSSTESEHSSKKIDLIVN